MTSELPLISFIIPVRNDAERLHRCLQSIRADTRQHAIEIIVADNGSTDRSARVAETAGAIVLSLPNRPVSQVRNAAARAARADLLGFVDADHELASGWTAEAIRRMADPAVWAAGADYHAPKPGTWVQRMYDCFRRRTPTVSDAEWLPSGNLVVRRSAFEQVHGFDETLESCEDVDFCRRIREAGGRLISAPALCSVHFGDPKSLRALFLSELWRGRDNIRVSLRERLTWRTAPSVITPIITLMALVAIVVGSFLTGFGSSWIAAAGIATFVGLSAFRAMRLVFQIKPIDRQVTDAAQALAVGGTYELARALALITRAGHGVRRKG
ncbi:MAG: glycosyltransferase [Acidobacteriota bacterium]